MLRRIAPRRSAPNLCRRNMSKKIPDDIKRFILTSISSVPHLEAMLLLRDEEKFLWDSAMLARRLYIRETSAAKLLSDLHAVGVVVIETDVPTYRYQPRSAELRRTIDQLASIYVKNIIQVTALIHSKGDKRAQQFADAFKLRKDS
jgi:hypothetical protein